MGALSDIQELFDKKAIKLESLTAGWLGSEKIQGIRSDFPELAGNARAIRMLATLDNKESREIAAAHPDLLAGNEKFHRILRQADKALSESFPSYWGEEEIAAAKKAYKENVAKSVKEVRKSPNLGEELEGIRERLEKLSMDSESLREYMEIDSGPKSQEGEARKKEIVEFAGAFASHIRESDRKKLSMTKLATKAAVGAAVFLGVSALMTSGAGAGLLASAAGFANSLGLGGVANGALATVAVSISAFMKNPFKSGLFKHGGSLWDEMVEIANGRGRQPPNFDGEFGGFKGLDALSNRIAKSGDLLESDTMPVSEQRRYGQALGVALNAMREAEDPKEGESEEAKAERAKRLGIGKCDLLTAKEKKALMSLSRADARKIARIERPEMQLAYLVHSDKAQTREMILAASLRLDSVRAIPHEPNWRKIEKAIEKTNMMVKDETDPKKGAQILKETYESLSPVNQTLFSRIPDGQKAVKLAELAEFQADAMPNPRIEAQEALVLKTKFKMAKPAMRAIDKQMEEVRERVVCERIVGHIREASEAQLKEEKKEGFLRAVGKEAANWGLEKFAGLKEVGESLAQAAIDRAFKVDLNGVRVIPEENDELGFVRNLEKVVSGKPEWLRDLKWDVEYKSLPWMDTGLSEKVEAGKEKLRDRIQKAREAKEERAATLGEPSVSKGSKFG